MHCGLHSPGALTSPPARCSGRVAVVIISAEQGDGGFDDSRIQPASRKRMKRQMTKENL